MLYLFEALFCFTEPPLESIVYSSQLEGDSIGIHRIQTSRCRIGPDICVNVNFINCFWAIRGTLLVQGGTFPSLFNGSTIQVYHVSEVN